MDKYMLLLVFNYVKLVTNRPKDPDFIVTVIETTRIAQSSFEFLNIFLIYLGFLKENVRKLVLIFESFEPF